MPFQASLQHLYVMPIKGEPEVQPKDYTDVPYDAYEYFTEQPSWNDINSQTHYIIIDGQHCVATHRLLIQEGSLSKEDERDAQSFIVTMVWSHLREWNLLTYYSRVLNQDLAGVRSEGNYLTLLGLARKSWVAAGSPPPSKNGLAHSNEFKVSLFSITSMICL